MQNQRGVLRSILVVGALVGVLGGAVWWWKSRDSDPAATQATPQAAGSAAPGSANPAAPGKPAPASLEVTVTDERGPIGNAAVRLAPESGEVVILRTDPDGIARADRLEPGEWQISASAAGTSRRPPGPRSSWPARRPRSR